MSIKKNLASSLALVLYFIMLFFCLALLVSRLCRPVSYKIIFFDVIICISQMFLWKISAMLEK